MFTQEERDTHTGYCSKTIGNYTLYRVQFPQKHAYMHESRGMLDLYSAKNPNQSFRVIVYQKTVQILAVNTNKNDPNYGTREKHTRLDYIKYLILLKSLHIPDRVIRQLDRYINECRVYERSLSMYSEE